MSFVLHGIKVQRPCARCLVFLNETQGLRTGQVKSVIKTKEMRYQIELAIYQWSLAS